MESLLQIILTGAGVAAGAYLALSLLKGSNDNWPDDMA